MLLIALVRWKFSLLSQFDEGSFCLHGELHRCGRTRKMVTFLSDSNSKGYFKFAVRLFSANYVVVEALLM